MKIAVAFGAQVCVVLKPGHFGENINNTWDFFWNVVLEKEGD